MTVFHRSVSSLSNGKRPSRPAGPRCRGGASSMLRLAQPASPRGGNLSNWLSRAATVLAPETQTILEVRPSEFAPSAWLVGH